MYANISHLNSFILWFSLCLLVCTINFVVVVLVDDDDVVVVVVVDDGVVVVVVVVVVVWVHESTRSSWNGSPVDDTLP